MNTEKNVIVQLRVDANRVLFNLEHVRTYSMELYENKKKLRNTFFLLHRKLLCMTFALFFHF